MQVLCVLDGAFTAEDSGKRIQRSSCGASSKEEDVENCDFLRMGPRLVGGGKLFKKSILYSRDKVELFQQVQNCECSWP